MKLNMSSFDLYAEVKELQSLIGSRLNKVFQVAKEELKLVFNVKGMGKVEMVIEAGRRIHLTSHPKPSPRKPSQFAMALRKHIGNAVLEAIEQVDFDRIAMLKFRGKAGESYTLVAELFGRGNVLLLSPEDEILAVMKPRRYSTREVVPKAKYELPPMQIDPFELGWKDIGEMVNSSKKDLVRNLATRMGFGKLYAEEVCLRAGLDKNKQELSDGEAKLVKDKIFELRERLGKDRARVVLKDGRAVDLTPVKLEIYRDREVEEFSRMDEALDAYFTRYEMASYREIKRKRFEKELDRYRKRLKSQTSNLRKHLSRRRRFKKLGDIIYQHYSFVERLLKILHRARKSHSWREIEKNLEQSGVSSVKRLVPSTGEVVVRLSGESVKLSLRKSVFENAEDYYSKSKKSKGKVEGALKAVRATAREIEKLKAAGGEAFEVEEPKPEKRARRKRRWYEKFRWFFSSDGFLVIAGKDATSNEVAVKKHLAEEDIFVHADIHGAPAVVIKTSGKEVQESTIREAFDFAASYSRAWKQGIASLEVYWVRPGQVSKRAESGEYIAKGSFVIRGKRNYGSGSVELAIGVVEEEPRVVAGPESAIASRTGCYAIVMPGREKSLKLARQVKSFLLERCKIPKEELNHEEIQRTLPPGRGQLKEVKG